MFGIASRSAIITLVALLCASTARGADTLCDPAASDCRAQVISLIRNEQIGIDLGFWFMQDSRYMTEIIRRWQAGVPVRILMDPRANATYAGNDTMLAGFSSAGIPMRKRTASGINHWKVLLFAGQNTVQFGSANYSPDAFVPSAPYTNYVSETVFVTTDPDVVNSFKTKFDDAWVNTSSYANYANITTALTRTYPTYPIDPEMNFVPGQDFATRSVGVYNKETLKIDAMMYRITDQRHTNAIISARQRGVPVRMIVDRDQYRDPKYYWDAWNVDRLYMAGVALRWQGHAGDNHEKLTLLYGQNLSIFGSSNWTTASASSQAEHNYFTTKNAIFLWLVDQFERMWHNSNPVRAAETVAFAPLPPDAPKYKSPATGSQLAGTSVKLSWYGGLWAHNYDVYLGTSPTPLLFAANLALGPSATTTTLQSYTTPALQPSTTYYWRIVSKTMANMTATGPVWSFTTPASGATPSLPAGWTAVDIGSVGVTGVSAYAGGTFTISGSGADVWGTADGLRFTYQTLTGDGQITARVASIPQVHAWSKAGVMIRNSLSSSSANAFMVVSAAKGLQFQYRASSGATSAAVAGALAGAPEWVRIVRAGNTITGYSSANGGSWTHVGSATIAMGATVYIGLGVTSHDNTRVVTASIDSVSR
jgi:phosphatidylserine/phosphatidylglycerophosphate/cardiolipin synthase-like enzyme